MLKKYVVAIALFILMSAQLYSQSYDIITSSTNIATNYIYTTNTTTNYSYKVVDANMITNEIITNTFILNGTFFDIKTNIVEDIITTTNVGMATNYETNKGYSNYLDEAFVPYITFSGAGDNITERLSTLIGAGLIYRPTDKLDISGSFYFNIGESIDDGDFYSYFGLNAEYVIHLESKSQEFKFGGGLYYSTMLKELYLTAIIAPFVYYPETKSGYYFEIFTLKYNYPLISGYDSFGVREIVNSIVLDVIKIGYVF